MNEDNSESLLLRLSIPPQNAEDKEALTSGQQLNIPDPVYGHQLQSFSVQGIQAEGKIKITFEELESTLPSGKVFTLKKPVYSVISPGYGSMHKDIQLSPRVAQQMIGLGLLEAISEQDLLALADPEDINQDGISGRPNQVWSRDRNAISIGRFGHKAGMPTINDQNQAAFSGDIGISTPLFPKVTGDCTSSQIGCMNAPHGNSPRYDNLEVSSEITELILFYTRNLAVPARRNPRDPDVLEGKKLFSDIGCSSCHQPDFLTENLINRPEHSNQLIWPYTDLLLHDMGPGLADVSTEGQATGSEWRTSPLWGIGLTEVVSGHTRFLHDGRAKNLTEAIMWHDGEAAGSRKGFIDLTDEMKQKLLKFVESL